MAGVPPKSRSKTTHAKSVTSVFRQYETLLKRYVARFFVDANDVEDIVQEAFARSFAAEKQQEIQFPKAFLFRVAHNLALKELKKNGQKMIDRIEDLSGFEVVAEEPLADERLAARQKLEIFCQAIDTLPPQCRQVLLLRKVYGLSHKEVARKLGIAVSTVEKHLAKGMQRCREYMQTHAGAFDTESGGPVRGTPDTDEDGSAT